MKKRILAFAFIAVACVTVGFAASRVMGNSSENQSMTCAAANEVVASSNASSGAKWVKVNDSCGRCVINDTTRKCGKCGGFMSEVRGSSKVVGDYVQANYRCKECGHSCTYKRRYQ